MRQNRKAIFETRMRTDQRNPRNTHGNDSSEDTSMSMTSLDESFPQDDPLLFRGN